MEGSSSSGKGMSTQTEQLSSFNEPSSASFSRIDSSLSMLTKQFIHLIQSAEKQCIDLKDAATVSA